MENTENKHEEKDSGSSEAGNTSTDDWCGIKWNNSKKKSTDSADATNQPSSPPPVPFNFNDPRLPPLKPLKPLHFKPLERVYNMSGNKLMLVFSHSIYSKHKDGQPPPRENTDQDVRRLHEVFHKELGFHIEVHSNKNYVEIRKIVRDLSVQDHSKTSCVCVVILTHGNSKDEVLAADKPYKVESLMKLLQNGNEWLVGKPKLYIVQACRGGKIEIPRLQLDNSGDLYEYLTTTHADALILRSSVEGHLSWNDKYGSWLIQELCRVAHATHQELDFQQMTTMVTSLVVHNHTTWTDDWRTDYTKQTPETRSTLTKLLRFRSAPGAGAETK